MIRHQAIYLSVYLSINRRDASPFDTTVDDGVRLVAAADRLAGGTAASSLTGGGVLAFYLLVVVGIGRAVRSSCGGTTATLLTMAIPLTMAILLTVAGAQQLRRHALPARRRRNARHARRHRAVRGCVHRPARGPAAKGDRAAGNR